MHFNLNFTPTCCNAFYEEYQKSQKLTLSQIKEPVGEDCWETFYDTGFPLPRKKFGGHDMSQVTPLCYKGLFCLFKEDVQFLVLIFKKVVVYQGYCDNINFFLSLCRGISPGGIWNDFSKGGK